MESKKPQGPSRAVLIASAIVLCLVLVGAAIFLRDEGARPGAGRRFPAASALQPLFERCDDTPTVEAVDGFTRTSCKTQTHPAFMIYSDADGDVLVRAGLMVPMQGRAEELGERAAVGLEMFSLFAGEPAESFLPSDSLAAIGVRETRFDRNGWIFRTQPMGNISLVFSVIPHD